MAAPESGLNDWWLSGFVNLIAAGMDATDARNVVLTWVPPEWNQEEIAGLIDDQATDATLIAQNAFDDREPADGWHYLTSSPMQTYETLVIET